MLDNGYRGTGKPKGFWEKVALSFSISLYYFFNKKSLVLGSVQHEGLLLEFAPKKYRDDLEIVRTAVENNYLSFQFASSKLRSNKKVVLKMLKINANVLEVLPPYYLSDEDVWLTIATAPHGQAMMMHMPIKLQGNKQYMLSILKKNGRLLEVCSSEIKADPQLVYIAVKKCPIAFQYAGENLKQDTIFVDKLKKDKILAPEWLNKTT